MSHSPTTVSAAATAPREIPVLPVDPSMRPQAIAIQASRNIGPVAEPSIPVADPSIFRRVFATDAAGGQRGAFKAFLSNIFMQLDEDKFFTLIDDVLSDRTLVTDQAIYARLASRISEAGLGKIGTFRAILRSLKGIQTDLSAQVATLMGTHKKIEGYAEIGYPGRMIRSLKGHLTLSGKTTVINDRESLTDYIQSGFPRPYDKFVALDDFRPIPESEVPSGSVDMVSCFIGLHHTPEAEGKLNAFLDSIKRILRPGGSFILMDHNAHSQRLKDLDWVVHSVFNAATGVTVREEAAEHRNFQSLSYWTDLLRERGFISTNEAWRGMRAGDPTLNTTCRFVKPLTTEAETAPFLAKQEGYKKEQLQTYFTAPEWYNVRASENYAHWIASGRHFFNYPFLAEVKSFWGVFGASFREARKHNTLGQILKSDYMLMNAFIGIFMTLEFTIKALLYSPLSLVFRGTKQLTTVDIAQGAIAHDYARFIESTPFYEYPYFRKLPGLFRSFSTSIRQRRAQRGLLATLFSRATLLDTITVTATTVDLIAKGILAKPVFAFYGPGENYDHPTHLYIRNPNTSRVEDLDERMGSIGRLPENTEHITLPHYRPFKDALANLVADETISIVDIAGQKHILIDIEESQGYNDRPNAFLEGCTELRHARIPSSLTQKWLRSVSVPVERLPQVIRSIKAAERETGNNVRLAHVHDF